MYLNYVFVYCGRRNAGVWGGASHQTVNWKPSGQKHVDRQRAATLVRNELGEAQRKRGSGARDLLLVRVVEVVAAPLIRAAAIDRESKPDTLEGRFRPAGIGDAEGREGVIPNRFIDEPEARGEQPVALTLGEHRGIHRGARCRYVDAPCGRTRSAGRLWLRLWLWLWLWLRFRLWPLLVVPLLALLALLGRSDIVPG